MAENNKGYEGYQKLIGTGPTEEQLEARKKAGVTSRSFDYNGKDNEWNCTVYFQNGDPLKMNFYIWSATREQMEASLQKDLGYSVEWSKWSGGNGHYSCELRRIK